MAVIAQALRHVTRQAGRNKTSTSTIAGITGFCAATDCPWRLHRPPAAYFSDWTAEETATRGFRDPATRVGKDHKGRKHRSLVFRARIILKCSAGTTDSAVATATRPTAFRGWLLPQSVYLRRCQRTLGRTQAGSTSEDWRWKSRRGSPDRAGNRT